MPERESPARLDLEDADFARVMDAAPLSLFITRQGRIVYANQRFLRAIGRSFEESIGFDPADTIVDPIVRENARQRLRKAEGGEAQSRLVYETQKADGTRLWAKIESTPCVFQGATAALSMAQNVTDEVVAVGAMRESEERYRRLFEGSPLPMAISRDTRVLLANSALARLAGVRSHKDLCGMSLLEFSEGEAREALSERLEAIQAGAELPSVSRPIRAPNGQTLDLDIISRPFIHDGAPAVLTLVVDVTEKQAAERRAKESDARYRQIIESSPNALVVSRDGVILVANATFAAFAGLEDVETLVGRDFLSFTTARSRPHAESRLRSVARGEQAPWIEAQVVRADGTMHDVEVRSEPYRHEGAPAVLTTMRDISERKSAERQQVERFRQLLDQLPDGILVHRENFMVFANLAAASMFRGASAESLVGHSVREFLPPPADPAVAGELVRVLQGEGASSVEIVARRFDGTRFDAQVLARRIQHEGAAAVQTVVRDITERKRAERSQAAIFAIAEASARALNLQDLLESVHGAIGELMHARNFFIALKDQSGENFTFPYHRDELGPPVVSVPVAETLSGHVLATGRPLLLDRNGMMALQEKGVPVFGPLAVSWIGVPLMVRDTSFGVLVLQSYREEIRYSEADRDLLSFVSHHIAEAIDRQRKEDQIEHLAFHDGLTGLPNRLLFEDRLATALAQSERRHAPLSVIFVDLDRFKVINDSLGHTTGDEVLRVVSKRLAGVIRDGDSLARRGGDEFLVLLPDTPPEGAVLVARKIIETVRAPIHHSGHDFTISASCGIAVFPQNGNDTESLLKAADIAMYRAKEGGRDGYRLFNPDMNAAAQRRLTVETRLRRSISDKQIGPHFQPILDASTGRVVAAEALLRWNPQAPATMPPKEFIPIAEQSGLIVALGAFVLRESLTQARDWPLSHGQPLRVSVNFAARQIQDPACVDLILQVLKDTSCPPDRLQLEVSESTQITEDASAIDRLRALKGEGVSIAIDDFGVGYSSLSRLKQLPFDTLKIDGTFIRDVTTDPSSGMVAGAVISLGQNLGLEVIAEGVETEAQKTLLLARGCRLMQGFVFAAALPPGVFEAWVRTREAPNTP